MSEQPPCIRCGRPMHDQGYACSICGSELVRELGVVARLAGEGVASIARQSSMDGGGRRMDTEPALPPDLAAAYDHDAGMSVLLIWARHVGYERGEPLPTVRLAPCEHWSCSLRRAGRRPGPLCAGEPAEHPTAVLTGWLSAPDRVSWLRHRPEAGQAFDEMLDACRLLVRVVDRRAERWYAGRCGADGWDGCSESLYPVAGASTVTCRSCGAVHDLDERKAALLVEAEEALAGAAWCAATLTRLGLPVTANRLRKWAERGRLVISGADASGRAVYRLGDVRDAVIAAQHDDRMRTLQAAVRTAELAEKRRQAEVDKSERLSA